MRWEENNQSDRRDLRSVYEKKGIEKKIISVVICKWLLKKKIACIGVKNALISLFCGDVNCSFYTLTS